MNAFDFNTIIIDGEKYERDFEIERKVIYKSSGDMLCEGGETMDEIHRGEFVCPDCEEKYYYNN